MFDRKDKPELYELLRTNKSKLGKLSAQEKQEQAASAPVAPPSDSDPIPYNNPPSSAASPYPKLKMPFPTLKPKEPTGVFQKPKPKPARPKMNEPGKPINYQKIIVIVGAIAVVLLILYLVSSQPKTAPSTPERATQPITDTRTPETPVAPVVSNRTWSIRLIYYNNNAQGQNSAQNRLRFLTEKGVSGVFTKNETIGGSACTVIYKGKYGSPEEAKKDLTNMKKLHYAFKNADAVEVK